RPAVFLGKLPEEPITRVSFRVPLLPRVPHHLLYLPPSDCSLDGRATPKVKVANAPHVANGLARKEQSASHELRGKPNVTLEEWTPLLLRDRERILDLLLLV